MALMLTKQLLLKKWEEYTPGVSGEPSQDYYMNDQKSEELKVSGTVFPGIDRLTV